MAPTLTKRDVDQIKKEMQDEMTEQVTEQVTQKVTQQVTQKVTQQVTEELSKIFDQKLWDELQKLGFTQHQEPQGVACPSPSLAHVSTKGSNAPVDVSESDDDDDHESDDDLDDDLDDDVDDELSPLYVDTPFHLVAMGKVHNLGPTIHHQKIAADFVRVEVVEVIDGAALVPIVSDEVKTVGQAPKQFIQWPKRLVNPNKKAKQAHQKGDDSDQVNATSMHKDPISCLLEMTKRLDGQPIQLILKGDVIGAADISIFLGSEEIMEICAGNQMLSTKILQVWTMYLHKLCSKKSNTHLYGFFDPYIIQDLGNKRDETQTYILTHLKDNKDCYLVPYYYPHHWQLFVLCPKQNIIVFLCSLGNKSKTIVKSVLDMAMQAHQITKNRRSSKPKWIKPVCQMKRGSHECGYHVMRHMDTIISVVVVDSWIETFNVQEPFTEGEINETRERWASFVYDATSTRY